MMGKELTRAQVEAMLIVDMGKPYAVSHSLVLAHDAFQRATIQQLEARVKELGEQVSMYEEALDSMGVDTATDSC